MVYTQWGDVGGPPGLPSPRACGLVRCAERPMRDAASGDGAAAMLQNAACGRRGVRARTGLPQSAGRRGGVGCRGARHRHVIIHSSEFLGLVEVLHGGPDGRPVRGQPPGGGGGERQRGEALFGWRDARTGTWKRLTYAILVSEMKGLLQQCGEDPERFGGQSFRRRGASFAHNTAGLPTLYIKALGDWLSDAFQIYIEADEGIREVAQQRVSAAVRRLLPS